MTRTSKVITLVLLGSSLALIGWLIYRAYKDSTDGHYSHSHYYGGFHSSSTWFWTGGSSRVSVPASSGTVRGGFGATGIAHGVGE